jgi:transmembrane sensor
MVVTRTAATGRGECDTLWFDDGTRVVLGAVSTLRYSVPFGARTRDVYLAGEAYFEVSHDGRRPFRVHAGDATAEDLGTAFGVRAYAEDSTVRVVVAEGKVALGATMTGGTAPRAILTPGELGRLARGTAVPSVQHVDVATYLGWTRGRLAFDDAPLAEVVAELARWYHTDFRIADASVATRRLTGSFTGTSLPEMLAVLAPVLDVRFERIGDTVIIHRTARSP